MIQQIENFLKIVGGLLLWLAPLSILLTSLIGPAYFLKVDYLKLIDTLVWPFTVLTALFFFKKVVTYLFFSMDEFNFFGLKGHLKNVDEVILEEVNRRFDKIKEEEKQRIYVENLNSEIENKEKAINAAQGTADENLNLAKEVIKEWRQSIKHSNKIIEDLQTDNRRLNELVSNLSAHEEPAANSISPDIAQTSDPIPEESEINKNQT